MPLLTQASGDSDRAQQGFGWHHCHSDASNEGTDWAQARIITHGYTAGGYKDSAPWKNINRTVHSNDTVGAGTANMSPKGDAGMSSAAMCPSYNFNYPSLGDTRPAY